MNDELVISHMDMVYFIIKKMGLYHKLEDYVDIGMIGLVKAGRDFDETKGYKFSTFAYTYVYREILRQIQTENYHNRKINQMTVPLDKPLTESGMTLLDTIASDINIEKEVEDIILFEKINEIIDTLNEEDKFTMKSYYELNGYEKKNMREVAEILNISKGCVGQRIQKAIKKIGEKLDKEWSETKWQ